MVPHVVDPHVACALIHANARRYRHETDGRTRKGKRELGEVQDALLDVMRALNGVKLALRVTGHLAPTQALYQKACEIVRATEEQVLKNLLRASVYTAHAKKQANAKTLNAARLAICKAKAEISNFQRKLATCTLFL